MWVGIFATLIILCSLLNTLLLIGIAGSLAKLIKYFSGDDSNDRDRWARIIRDRRYLQMRDPNQVTYADNLGLQRPQRRRSESRGNWDGLPSMDDE